ncbi:MAG TPA: DNA replication and repair protein RecF [Flavisolibacter sp.]|jgi:DNA replication and repair protein RecF|nr:DNA replication and repair protein RecF [Flavisolibacter sp.]
MALSLHSISLFQFKNYFQQDFRFNERIVGICGRNGVGKTNLLDAIHYLCFTKSYFSRQDQTNSYQGSQGFRIQGQFELDRKAEKAVCIVRETGKKEFSVNDESYSRFSKHIGRYPCVIIAPDDVQLIIGGSEERRKFMDTLLSQLDHEYLQSLINYTRILQQRNSFLRSYAEGFSRDTSVLDVLDEQLAMEGNRLFEKRRAFSLRFLPVVKNLYNDICQRYEDITLLYESEMQQVSMDELLQLNRQKDLNIQRTSGGVHRDELIFRLGGQAFKAIASQGQRKSLLFALKLGEMEILKEEKRLSPILLLDDVFEKLDEERITNLLERVCADEETCIFITDTSCTRLQAQFEKLGQPIQLISL